MKEVDKIAIIPSYYKDFHCIGGTCEDTCCAGWQIYIDEKTYNKYKKVKHPEMTRRLSKEIVVKKAPAHSQGMAKIKLKNNRCAFLTSDGWCDIYNHLGESYLSDTCAQYPRTLNKVGSRYEYSLTTSCPEATRHILGNKQGITFEIEGPSERIAVSATVPIDEVDKKVWRDYFFEIRESAWYVLQQKEFTFEERLVRLGAYFEWIDTKIAEEDLEAVAGGVACELSNGSSSILWSSRQVLELAVLLKQLFKEKKQRIERYQVVLQQVLEGIKLDGKIAFKDAKEAYEEGSSIYDAYFKEHAYLLENYFVNYMYERCMPLDSETTLESYKRMVLYYHLIKLHLVGIAQVEGRLDEEMVIGSIQIFTKIYDHGENYIQHIQEVMLL